MVFGICQKRIGNVKRMYQKLNRSDLSGPSNSRKYGLTIKNTPDYPYSSAKINLYTWRWNISLNSVFLYCISINSQYLVEIRENFYTNCGHRGQFQSVGAIFCCWIYFILNWAMLFYLNCQNMRVHKNQLTGFPRNG